MVFSRVLFNFYVMFYYTTVYRFRLLVLDVQTITLSNCAVSSSSHRSVKSIWKQRISDYYGLTIYPSSSD